MISVWAIFCFLMMPCCVAARPCCSRVYSAWTCLTELLQHRNVYSRLHTIWCFHLLMIDEDPQTQMKLIEAPAFYIHAVARSLIKRQMSGYREHSSNSQITFSITYNLSSSMLMLFYPICSKHALHPRPHWYDVLPENVPACLNVMKGCI